MRIGIIEDEQEEANASKEYLTRIMREYHPNEKESLVIDIFASAEDFLDKFAVKKYDLLLFDIGLGEMNGMQAAKKARAIDGEVSIIFLTGNPDFALEGYDVFAAGYILKPLSEHEGEFKRTAERIFGKQKERLKELKVSVKGVSFSIPAGNIFLIDIDWRHRLVLHLENEDFILSQSYESLQKELMGDSRFLECHHRILVNMEKIALMEKDEFILSNGAKVPISQRRKRESKAKYMSFLARK